mmetsp:Transcript_8683/g.11758  ORF Transcript_8683/g.11758 Transcript_8683/m.11758 type:complete len:142 (-) Transcript_8683:490-915(-)
MGLRAGERIMAQNRALLRSNMSLLEGFFASHPNVFSWHPPKGATVAFPELVTGQSSEEWCKSLVKETGILLLPAMAYDYQPEDGRQHFRIGFGRKNMPEVIALLDKHLLQKGVALSSKRHGHRTSLSHSIYPSNKHKHYVA